MNVSNNDIDNNNNSIIKNNLQGRACLDAKYGHNSARSTLNRTYNSQASGDIRGLYRV